MSRILRRPAANKIAELTRKLQADLQPSFTLTSRSLHAQFTFASCQFHDVFTLASRSSATIESSGPGHRKLQ